MCKRFHTLRGACRGRETGAKIEERDKVLPMKESLCSPSATKQLQVGDAFSIATYPGPLQRVRAVHVSCLCGVLGSIHTQERIFDQQSKLVLQPKLNDALEMTSSTHALGDKVAHTRLVHAQKSCKTRD